MCRKACRRKTLPQSKNPCTRELECGARLLCAVLLLRQENRQDCLCHVGLLRQKAVCAEDQAEGQERDDQLAYCAHYERAETLLAQLADVGAQAYSGEGEQERPARKVG